MWNLLLALGAGLVVFGGLYLPHVLRLGEALVPALLTLLLAYGILARRSFKHLEKLFQVSSTCLHQHPPNFGQAITMMQRGYRLAPWQLGIRSQIDLQIGVIYFLQQEFAQALPYLRRAYIFGHWLGAAMLGVIYYKKKDYPPMHKAFTVATTRGKKHGLAWTLYAYLLSQIGDVATAQKILVKAQKHVPADPRVGEALLAVRNGKKIRMKSYREQWYQFHLERPPLELQGASLGKQRVSRVARRGRWS